MRAVRSGAGVQTQAGLTRAGPASFGDTMADQDQPAGQDKADAARAARAERQAAALRENLRRRKEQTRVRRDGDPPPGAVEEKKDFAPGPPLG